MPASSDEMHRAAGASPCKRIILVWRPFRHLGANANRRSRSILASDLRCPVDARKRKRWRANGWCTHVVTSTALKLRIRIGCRGALDSPRFLSASLAGVASAAAARDNQRFVAVGETKAAPGFCLSERPTPVGKLRTTRRPSAQEARPWRRERTLALSAAATGLRGFPWVADERGEKKGAGMHRLWSSRAQGLSLAHGKPCPLFPGPSIHLICAANIRFFTNSA
jgi:hypothetical protein